MYNKLLRGEIMVVKLERYSSYVELANKERQLNSSLDKNIVISDQAAYNRKVVNDILSKYINILGPEELNILELNLYIADNSLFLHNINLLANEVGFETFKEVLASSKIKTEVIIRKLLSMYKVDRQIIIRKIKEIFTYQDEIEKKKIR